MTVNSTTNRVSYAGNGTTKAFAVSFPFLADADLVVLERTDSTGAEVTKTLTTHYTVSGAGGSSGTVTMVTAPATGVTLIIYRDPALTQLVDLVENDPLPVETAVEQPLDRLTMISQRTRELVERALRLPDGDIGFVAADMNIPAKVTRAGNYLAFDADGKPIASAGTGTDPAASAFMATVLGDANALKARSTLNAVGRVSTVAALRALTVSDLAEGDVVEVQNYASAGDRGGGLFYWAASDVQVDNGGTVILPTGHTGNGRWLRRHDGVVSVKWFGAVGDGIVNDQPSIQAAIDSTPVNGGRVYLPPGNYNITSAVTLKPGLTLSGDNYLTSQITVTGAINGLVYQPSVLTEVNINIEDLRVIGSSAASTLDLVSMVRCGVGTIRRCNLRDTSKSCIRLHDNCIRWTVEDCTLESFTEYGIHTTTFSSVLSVRGTQINANAVTGLAVIFFDGSEILTIESLNVNGNARLSNVVRNGIRVLMRGVYAEGLTGPAVLAAAAADMTGLVIDGANFSTADSVSIDLNNGVAHEGVYIAGVRSPDTTGTIFSPGSTASFVYRGVPSDGRTHVSGFTGETEVHKRKATAVVASALRLQDGGNLSGTSVTVGAAMLYTMNNGAATNVTDILGGLGTQVIFVGASNGNTTLVHDVNKIRLAGGANKTLNTNETVMLLHTGGNVWRQIL